MKKRLISILYITDKEWYLYVAECRELKLAWYRHFFSVNKKALGDLVS